MEERLPEVRRETVDEDHFGLAPLADAVSQPRRELEPGGAAAHDHNAMGRINLVLRVTIQHGGSPENASIN